MRAWHSSFFGFVLIGLFCFGFGWFMPTASAAKQPKVDPRCQLVADLNGFPGENVDIILNYYGCDEVYDGNVVIGFARGRSYCERAAYRYGLLRHQDGEQFHRSMGRAGCALISDDWSWDIE